MTPAKRCIAALQRLITFICFWVQRRQRALRVVIASQLMNQATIKLSFARVRSSLLTQQPPPTTPKIKHAGTRSSSWLIVMLGEGKFRECVSVASALFKKAFNLIIPRHGQSPTCSISICLMLAVLISNIFLVQTNYFEFSNV